MLNVVLTSTNFDADPRHSQWTSTLVSKFGHVEEWQFIGVGSNSSKNGTGILVTRNLNEIPLVSMHSSLRASELVLEKFTDSRTSRSNKIVNEIIKGSKVGTSITHTYLVNQLKRMAAALALVSVKNSPTLVIANDLLAAVAATAVWPDGETNVVYDAQEVFTDMYKGSPADKMTEKEEEFWLNLETLICSNVCHVVTVSPGIADLYQKRHNVVASVIPNWLSLSAEAKSSRIQRLPLKFVYMGHAAPHRGLEDLILQWNTSKDQATLDLYIPERPYTQTLRSLIKKRSNESSRVQIRLNPPVPPSMMVETLANFDVGVIPYDHPYPYNHCSPNKLGQYLAAGLAIISNDLPFVKQSIAEADCGYIFDWKIPESFSNCVSRFSSGDLLENLKENARSAFLSDKNWEKVIRDWDSATSALTPLVHKSVNKDWAFTFANLAIYPDNHDNHDNHDQIIAMVSEDRLTFKQAIVSALSKIGLRDSVRTRRIFIQLSKVPVIGGVAKKIAKSLI